MPTYEYICEKCGHHFDQSQPMSAAPLAICPKELCHQARWGKGKVKRAITGGAGLIFKGSGFYITDYRSDSYKEGAKKDSSASTKTETKSSATESKSGTAKAETKPAKTSTPKT
jgi:putative FmdB family regulatory protein